MSKLQLPSQLRAAVIGYGGAYNMGRAHLEQMQAAGMTPAAIVEVNPERRDVASKEWPDLPVFATVEAMLAESDANIVTIITPHNTHAELAIQCLEAGRHVVCEKPFALTTAECDRMIAVAAERDLIVSTYHNRHWDGCIVKALEVVRSGVLGDIVRVDARMGRWTAPKSWWRDSKSISGGILYDWGVHLLEYTFQILTAPVTEVSGFVKNGFWAAESPWKEDTIEDEGHITLRYQSGQWSSLRISRLGSEESHFWLTITGTKGLHSFEGGRFRTTTFDRNNTVVTESDNPPNQWHLYYANLANHICKGDPLVISPEWARRPVHVIDLGLQSATQGRALAPVYS